MATNYTERKWEVQLEWSQVYRQEPRRMEKICRQPMFLMELRTFLLLLLLLLLEERVKSISSIFRFSMTSGALKCVLFNSTNIISDNELGTKIQEFQYRVWVWFQRLNWLKKWLNVFFPSTLQTWNESSVSGFYYDTPFCVVTNVIAEWFTGITASNSIRV
jgi:hypothetical protein